MKSTIFLFLTHALSASVRARSRSRERIHRPSDEMLVMTANGEWTLIGWLFANTPYAMPQPIKQLTLANQHLLEFVYKNRDPYDDDISEEEQKVSGTDISIQILKKMPTREATFWFVVQRSEQGVRDLLYVDTKKNHDMGLEVIEALNKHFRDSER